VAWVKLTTNGIPQFGQPNEENGKNVYTFCTPNQLTVLKSTNVEIEVKSEDEVTVKKYTLSISSSLIPPENLELGKSEDRGNIMVNFDRSKDSRVDGYVILRGLKGDSIPDIIPNKVKITDGGTYKDFTSIVISKSDNLYKDGVGGGSPYYSYRVFAFDTTEGSMVFSKGSDQHTRSVGRIKITYKMTDFGGEHYMYGVKGRAFIEADVTLYAGNSTGGRKLTHWYGYDWKAGNNDNKDAVFFLSDLEDKEDIMPNTAKHTDTIGSEGLYLYFDVLSKSCEDAAKECNATTTAKNYITWSYNKMAAVLKDGTTGDGQTAPYKGSFKYLMGSSGFDYNPKTDICSKDCGDEPHTGYIFDFDYEWVDDDDTY
jgi:hypothetical protein